MKLKNTIKILLCAIASTFLASTSVQANGEFYGDIPNYGEKYLSPESIHFAPDGKLLIGCRTGKILKILDAKAQPLADIEMSGFISSFAISQDSKLAYVTIQAPEGSCAVVDLTTYKVIKEFPVGHMPRASLISNDGKTLYIINEFANEIIAFDINTFEKKSMGNAVREPYSMVQSKDGKKLYVLNLHPAPKGGLFVEDINIVLTVLDAQTLTPLNEINLGYGAINGTGLAISPDGKYVYATHVVARFNVPTSQVEKGWVDTNAVGVINTEKDEMEFTFLLDDVDRGFANPYGVNITEDGKTLIVVGAGTHELSIIDRIAMHEKYEKNKNHPDKNGTILEPHNDLAFVADVRKRIALDGFGPRFAAIRDNSVVTTMYYSDTLNILNLDDPMLKPKKWSIGGNEVLNEIRRGDLYFHDASLCFQNWLSCATCHTEVRSDNLNWDLLNDGMGNPKQSKSMLYAHQTPPSMITGIRKFAEIAVRKGITHIQFAVRPEEDAVCIDKYLTILEAVPSPFLYNKKYEDAIRRGAAIFEDADCSMCHNGKYFTNMEKVDVGSGLNEYEGFAFDTPTLREVWRTAPYLYDGRAVTIFDMLKNFNKEDKHGRTSHLTDDELRDLEAYVLSL